MAAEESREHVEVESALFCVPECILHLRALQVLDPAVDQEVRARVLESGGRPILFDHLRLARPGKLLEAVAAPHRDAVHRRVLGESGIGILPRVAVEPRLRDDHDVFPREAIEAPCHQVVHYGLLEPRPHVNHDDYFLEGLEAAQGGDGALQLQEHAPAHAQPGNVLTHQRHALVLQPHLEVPRIHQEQGGGLDVSVEAPRGHRSHRVDVHCELTRLEGLLGLNFKGLLRGVELQAALRRDALGKGPVGAFDALVVLAVEEGG
mmetsp:Transcript_20962/g.66411  ORF Transcript_20962/g.66411 Transcript_20962/m.66411 type:complete len:263 (-) Transcript_20962:874-1662(-)